MQNRKQFILAASVVALLGATTWAQAPYGNSTQGDSTRNYSKVGSSRDSMSSDSATRRNSMTASDQKGVISSDQKGLTASDQKNDKPDVDITAKIRREIMARKGMSVNAQNVKIITIAGKVTLKGVVDSASEKEIVAQIATTVAGSKNVTNDLQINQK